MCYLYSTNLSWVISVNSFQQDNSTEEEIWKEGFAVCFTAGVPSVVKELCFLCGSKGKEKVSEFIVFLGANPGFFFVHIFFFAEYQFY